MNTALLAIALSFFVFPFEGPAKEAVQEERSVSTRLVPSGYKEVIQRVESKLQPTAVQVHETVDPTTGASKQASCSSHNHGTERTTFTNNDTRTANARDYGHKNRGNNLQRGTFQSRAEFSTAKHCLSKCTIDSDEGLGKNKSPSN